MKRFSLLLTISFFTTLTLAADPASAPSAYPLADAVGCKMMVRGALPAELVSLNLANIESVTCACVDRKLRDDAVMLTLLGSDREAKKKLITRENLQQYMIAKGMSYTFACVAPSLSDAADRAVQR